ncbi:MAG TPA: ABC transporter permease subunit [Candidatus Acidoferrales bacterium]|nr:ABC transporter permease subunit [Candidatus Acidoferrales bacterium]
MGRDGVIRQLVVLTARQAVGRRRILVALLAAAVPVFVAVVYRLAGGGDAGAWASGLLGNVVITTLLPLVALVFGTAVLGGEVEDGTLVYLLVRPVARWQVVVAKLAVGALATALVVGASAALALLVVLPSGVVTGTILAALAGIAWGALIYSAIAVALSLVTGHALIVGLVYVYIWEGVVAGLFTGTRLLSVHQYVLGVVAALDPTQPSLLPAHLPLSSSVELGALVGVGATLVAAWSLARFEVSERP